MAWFNLNGQGLKCPASFFLTLHDRLIPHYCCLSSNWGSGENYFWFCIMFLFFDYGFDITSTTTPITKLMRQLLLHLKVNAIDVDR